MPGITFIFTDFPLFSADKLSNIVSCAAKPVRWSERAEYIGIVLLSEGEYLLWIAANLWKLADFLERFVFIRSRHGIKTPEIAKISGRLSRRLCRGSGLTKNSLFPQRSQRGQSCRIYHIAPNSGPGPRGMPDDRDSRNRNRRLSREHDIFHYRRTAASIPVESAPRLAETIVRMVRRGRHWGKSMRLSFCLQAPGGSEMRARSLRRPGKDGANTPLHRDFGSGKAEKTESVRQNRYYT